MAEKILEITHLHVTYRTDEALIYAVNDLELTVEKGQTVGLVGETGAGKTTTALSVLRLLPSRIGTIEQGEILLEGRSILSRSEADMRLLRGRDVSMIFQDPMTALNPILTVGEQIGEVVRLHNRTMPAGQVERKVDEMLLKVGISVDRKNEFPHQFSGGMRQRIVIAIALACNPKLLIADEPTTALDVTIQAQVLKMMKALKKEFQTAMLLITHDLGVVAQSCDHVAVMYAGEIIESGSARDIFNGRRHHPYTTGLFGSIPSLIRKTRRLTPIDGMMPDPAVRIAGCSFAGRCPRRMPVCAVKPSPMAREGHMLRCHLFAESSEVPS